MAASATGWGSVAAQLPLDWAGTVMAVVAAADVGLVVAVAAGVGAGVEAVEPRQHRRNRTRCHFGTLTVRSRTDTRSTGHCC